MRAALPAVMAAALWVSAPARAQWGDDISVQDIAKAEREEKAAQDKVDAEHGNRPPQQLSAEERAQMIREQQAATSEVLERRALDAKSFATRQARMDQEEQARREREAAAAANAGSQEVEITRGVDEKHPVDLYRAPGEVEVEHLSEGGGEGEEAPAAKPAGKSSKGSKPSRGLRGVGPPQKSSRGKKSRHK